MGNRNKIPDAWDDDDWEVQADRAAKEDPPKPQPEAPMTRAERLARHAEEQRQLWQSAETPSDQQPFFAPPPTNPIPLTTPFKPAVKVLSRKPAPKLIARRDPATGLERLTLQDDGADDEDDDPSARKKQETPDEMRRRQQRELEEKQRQYDEARAKIFGDSAPSSGQSSPRTGTPPLGPGDGGRGGYRGGRGRGRGGRGGRGGQDSGGRQERGPQGGNYNNNNNNNNNNAGGRSGGNAGELFDPSYSPKPGSNFQKRGDPSSQPGSRPGTPRVEDQIIRTPRGPDPSGRGGFGFARRGAPQG